MWPEEGQQIRMYSNVRGRALVAKETAASVSIGTTPAVWIWPEAPTPDDQYDPVTGIITIAEDCFFNSTASWRVVGSTNRQFYADADFSLDDGVTWIPGTDSVREEQASTASRTMPFPFNGFFPAGTKLRFMVWASGAGVTVQSLTVNSRRAPASRLTYNTVTGSKITP